MARLSAAISLIIILIAQSGGSYLLIRGLQLRLKNEAHAKINEGLTHDQLIVIKADEATSLIWTEDDEFQWKGIMFDVVYTEIHDSVIWYYCYQDEDETELMALWDRYLHSQPDEDSHPTLISSLKWLFGSYIYAESRVALSDQAHLSDQFLPVLVCRLLQMPHAPDSPPPQYS